MLNDHVVRYFILTAWFGSCLLQVIYILHPHIIMCVQVYLCTSTSFSNISSQVLSKRLEQKVATLRDTTNTTINETLKSLTWVTF